MAYRQFFIRAAKARYYAAGLLESRLIGQKLDILFNFYGGYVDRLSFAFRYSPHRIRQEELSIENLASCDLVIPLTTPAIRFVNKYRDLVPNNPIPIPSDGAVDLCDDKFLFSTVLSDAGFSEFIPRIGPQQCYPYLLKKRVSNTSYDVFIIKDEADEKNYVDQLQSDEFFCQEIVAGQSEYAAHVLFKGNKIVKSLNFECQFDAENPIKNKDPHSPHRISPCPHLDLFADILRSVGFEGLCCFDYKEQNGRPMILELNPRIGASLCQFSLPFVTAALRS
jgi:hypothetical protein